MAIMKQELRRLKVDLRWCASERNLADALTKDQAEPVDLLRAVMKSGEYVLASEESVLEQKAAEKEERLRRSAARAMANQAGEGTGRGGMRDYWLPMPTRRYLVKVAGSIIAPETIKKVRLHGIPRNKMMSNVEARGVPTGTRRLTLYREVAEDGRMGTVKHRDDVWSVLDDENMHDNDDCDRT